MVLTTRLDKKNKKKKNYALKKWSEKLATSIKFIRTTSRQKNNMMQRLLY